MVVVHFSTLEGSHGGGHLRRNGLCYDDAIHAHMSHSLKVVGRWTCHVVPEEVVLGNVHCDMATYMATVVLALPFFGEMVDVHYYTSVWVNVDVNVDEGLMEADLVVKPLEEVATDQDS